MRMTRLELVHWMNGFCMALQAAAMSKLRKACELYASSDAGKPQVQEFSVRQALPAHVVELALGTRAVSISMVDT